MSKICQRKRLYGRGYLDQQVEIQSFESRLRGGQGKEIQDLGFLFYSKDLEKEVTQEEMPTGSRIEPQSTCKKQVPRNPENKTYETIHNSNR